MVVAMCKPAQAADFSYVDVAERSAATVTYVISAGIDADGTGHGRIEALVSYGPLALAIHVLADELGSGVRPGPAYASVLHGAPGMIVDNAVVPVRPPFDQHDIKLAAPAYDHISEAICAAAPRHPLACTVEHER